MLKSRIKMIWLALVIHVTMYNAIWCLQVKITSPLAKYAINSTAVVRGEITEIIRLGHTFVWNFKNVTLFAFNGEGLKVAWNQKKTSRFEMRVHNVSEHSIVSYLHIKHLQKQENGSEVNIEFASEIKARYDIKVEYCKTLLPNCIEIRTQNPTYNQTGYFSCPVSGYLFDKSLKTIVNHQTVCETSAKWSNENGVECWYSPAVKIRSNFFSHENGTISASCEYENVYPAGKYNLFYFRGAAYSLLKNQSFITPLLNAYDNNQHLSCQAVTPTTRVLNDTGRSKNVTLNVYHKPFQDTLTTCEWIINATQSCFVTFFSNPASSLIGLRMNVTEASVLEEAVTALTSSNGRQILYFQKKNVTMNDAGKYILTVNSSIFGEHNITFHIKIIEPTVPDNTLSIIIGFLSSLLTLIIFSVIVFGRIKQKREHEMKHKYEYILTEGMLPISSPFRDYEYAQAIHAIPGPSYLSMKSVNPTKITRANKRRVPNLYKNFQQRGSAASVVENGYLEMADQKQSIHKE